MKFVSWNINSLRAHEPFFREAITSLQPDAFCLQEIKVREDQRTFPVKGYRSFMNPADPSQYYGTGVFIKNSIHPLSITFDPPMPGYDYQGRIQAMELNDFFLVNTYWPFSSNGYWLEYRLKWTERFQLFIHQLQETKPVIICGDMNTVRQPIDAFDGKVDKKAGCYYKEERTSFEELLRVEHLIDTYRQLHPAPLEHPAEHGHYSTWVYSKDNAIRKENLGFRIDFFLVSECLMERVKASEILPDIYGSDHCPIILEIK